MSANRIEIAQTSNAPVRGRNCNIVQHLFDVKFATTIRIGGAGRMVFAHREVLGFAVNRGTAAEDQRLDLRQLHGLQQTDGALDIVGEVVDRFFNGLANRFESRKMNDSIN